MSKLYKATFTDAVIFFLLISPILIQIIMVNSNWESRGGWYQNYQNARKVSLLEFNLIYLFLVQLYLLFKDVLNISVGKRTQKMIIVDRKTRKEAHWLKKIIRNISLFFTPTLLLEIVLKLITPASRFGDMIVDTEIIERK